jgi:hypothetical protein
MRSIIWSLRILTAVILSLLARGTLQKTFNLVLYNLYQFPDTFQYIVS